MAKIVEFTKSGLEKDIQNGMSRKEMATKYGISTVNLAKALKEVGLSNKRPPSVIIRIVEEVEEQPLLFSAGAPVEIPEQKEVENNTNEIVNVSDISYYDTFEGEI